MIQRILISGSFKVGKLKQRAKTFLFKMMVVSQNIADALFVHRIH